MSKLTEILKLFCYDPETDGANTFNIPKALNENWEKIDQLVLLAVAAAAAYDPEGSYAVGDYCTQGGKLHKCSTPIDGGEAWNAEHWTETTVAVELAEVRTSLSNKVSAVTVSLPKGTDLNDILTVGSYAITGANASGVLNMPVAAAGRMYVFQGDTVVLQVWTMNTHTSAENGKVLFYRKYTPPELGWSEWWKIAVATPPQDDALTLSSGMGGSARYFKTQENIGYVFGWITGAQIDKTVATLPVGYLPKFNTVVTSSASSNDDTNNSVRFRFNTDGRITVEKADNPTALQNGMALVGWYLVSE